MARTSPTRPDNPKSGLSSLARNPKPNTNAPAAARVSEKPKESTRDTAEAIVVAFILALIVRGFVVEAFVIPTGSMAPTLMGRHKEVACPQCGYTFSVNAAEEAEGPRAGTPEGRVYTGICVNCRFQSRVDREPSFKGDRILVMKFPYDLPMLPGSSGPQRWDVVVFRYPEKPDDSYIKRLVGLPGDTVRIWYGDIFIKNRAGEQFRQERRPLEHQVAMQQVVYDDRYRPEALRDRPEWRRWLPTVADSWREEATKPGTFLAEPGASPAELRYQHVLPDPVQWRAIAAGDPYSRPARPMLITDFASYNTNLPARSSDLTGRVWSEQANAWDQPHWVGDLTISARVQSESAKGAFALELIEGGVVNRCAIDLATGSATLLHGSTTLGTAKTSMTGFGRHDVVFANVDNRLTLWIDGTPVFGEGKTYEDARDTHPEPTDEDLAPVRVQASGGKIRVSELVLKRDIYYTLDPGRSDYTLGRSWDDPRLPRTPVELAEMLADPAKVRALGPLTWGDYPIGEDRFLMLGDNSPRSKDSRGWRLEDKYDPMTGEGWDDSDRARWEVPRRMLTGKAFAVFWPHGKPFGPDIRLFPDFRVPFRPYLERMKWIH